MLCRVMASSRLLGILSEYYQGIRSRDFGSGSLKHGGRLEIARCQETSCELDRANISELCRNPREVDPFSMHRAMPVRSGTKIAFRLLKSFSWRSYSIRWSSRA